MKIKVILAFFLCSASFMAIADNGLKALMEKGVKHLRARDYEQAKKVLNEALIKSFEGDFLKERAAIFNNIGVADWRMGSYKEGVEACELALEVYKEIGNDTLIAESQYNLGLVLKRLGNNQLAIRNFSRGLHLFEKIKDEENIAKVYDALGNVYKDLENYKEAIRYHQSAMKTYKSHGDEEGVSRALHNLGQVYNDSGDYSKARTQLFQAKRMKQRLKISTAAVDAQIGTYFNGINELDSAEIYFKLSLDVRKKEGNSAKLATAYWQQPIGTWENY